MKARSIDILSQKSHTHAQTIAKEAAEAADMQSAISSITSQRDAQAVTCDTLRSSLAATQKAINARLEAQRAHTARMDAQARFNAPELDFWEDYLCLRIDGMEAEDQLRFVFTHVDSQDWSREASFELFVDQHEYRVGKCRPKLDKERLEVCLEKANEGRDVARGRPGRRERLVAAMGPN